MNDTTKRIAGYGVTALLIAGVSYVGFVREAEADAMTLLGAAHVQLTLAHSFPENDQEGRPNEIRVKLLRDVESLIERARTQDPSLHSGYELAAHLRCTSGDYLGAADLFNQAQGSRDATPETTVIDRLNEARMLRAANEPERALAVVEPLSKFLTENATSALVERAHALLELGRKEDATRLARRIASFTEEPRVLVDVGLILESQNETGRAEAAFQNAAVSEPLANYYLARLKIRAQEFDSGVDLLKRAVAADGPQVKSMLEHDAAIWEPLHNDERYTGLFTSAVAPVPQGR